jgi:hypothetical protein
VLLLLPPQAMAEQDWTPSKVMQGNLQILMNQGFMIAAELAACRVPEDPVFPAPTDRYVVTFMAFYERGFGVPSHQFLRSLLWYYRLELHNLTPSGVLHIASFMTLCKACMGVDPKFNMLKYFFRVRHPQGLDMELTVLECSCIHVKFGHGVDPYFNILVPILMKGMQKKWFYMRNDASTPLLTLTDSPPIPLPSWGDGVARRDLSKLQPMCEALQQFPPYLLPYIQKERGMERGNENVGKS